LIRHAGSDPASAIVALTVPVIESSFGALLVAAIGAAPLLPISLLAAQRAAVALIVILGKVSAKERYPQLLLRARACGNVKNLSLLSGYTGGGRRPAVMNM
jgi:hypothetical protein